jgi:hypothetical protein
MAKVIFGDHSSVLSSSGMGHDYERFWNTAVSSSGISKIRNTRKRRRDEQSTEDY